MSSYKGHTIFALVLALMFFNNPLIIALSVIGANIPDFDHKFKKDNPNHSDEDITNYLETISASPYYLLFDKQFLRVRNLKELSSDSEFAQALEKLKRTEKFRSRVTTLNKEIRIKYKLDTFIDVFGGGN